MGQGQRKLEKKRKGKNGGTCDICVTSHFVLAQNTNGQHNPNLYMAETSPRHHVQDPHVQHVTIDQVANTKERGVPYVKKITWSPHMH